MEFIKAPRTDKKINSNQSLSFFEKQFIRISLFIGIVLLTFISQNNVLAQAGPDKTIVCNVTNLNATGTGTWTTPPGVTIAPAQLTNPNAPATIILGAYGAYTLTWTPTVGAADPVVITYHQVTAAGILSANCSNTTLTGSNPGGTYTGAWTSNNAGVIITNSTSPAATASNLPAGVGVTFTWTVTIEGCSQSANFVLTNTTPSGIDAGVTPIEVCTNNTQNLSAALGTGISGSWSFSVGSGTFDNSTSPSAIVSNLVSGVNILRWTVVKGVCSTSDDITLNNNSVSALGTDQTVCGTTATLSGNLPVGSSGLWTKNPIGAPAIITTPTSATSGVTNLQVGVNTFIWTLTKGGCNSSDLFVTVTQTVLTAAAGPDQNSVCAASTNLVGNLPVLPETGAWTLVAGSGTIANSALNTTAVTALSGITPNIFRWTLSRPGCTPVSDDVTILSNALPVNAGADQLGVCGSSITLSATSSDPATYGGTGLWSTGTTASILTPSNYTSIVNNLTPATSTFRWTVTKNSCSVWDEMIVTRNTYAVDAGIDQYVCSNSAVLNGSDPGPGGSGSWSVISGTGSITSPASRSTTINNITSFPITLRWSVIGSCTGSDDVTIYPQGTTQANIALSSDNALCGNNFYNNLSAVTGPKVTETDTWYQINGAGVTFSAPNAQTTNVNNLTVPGSHQIVYQITDGVCTTKDTIVINTFVNGVAAAGADIGAVGNCSEYIQLNATPVAAPYTGTWSRVGANSQNVFIENPNLPNTRIRTYDDAVKDSEFFTLRWTVSNGSCSTSDDVNVRNNYTAFAAIASGASGYVKGDKHIYLCSAASLVLDGYPNSANASDGGWEIPANYGASFQFGPGAGNTGCIATTGTNQEHKNYNATLNISGVVGDFILIWHQCGGPASGACNSKDTLFFHVQLDMTNGPAVFAAGGTQYYTAAGVKMPFAGIDQNICGTTASISSVNPVTDGIANTSGIWSYAGGSFANATSYSTTVTGLAIGPNTIRWTVTNGCSSVYDELNVNVSGITGTEAGSDQTICPTSTTMAATAPGVGSTGQWTVKSGGGTIAAPTAFNSAVTNLLQGRNVFLWTVTSPFCTAIDSVVIYSGIPNKPDAGPDQTFCGSGAMQGIPPVIGTAAWSVVSGGATINAPNSATSNVTPLVSPSTLRWTVTQVAPNGLMCTNFDDVIVNNNTPTAAFAGADQPAVCGSTGLAANSPGVGETGLWQTTFGTGTFTNNTVGVTTVSAMQLGLNTYRWTITKGLCTSSDLVDITSQGIAANINTANQNTCLTTIPLIADNPTPGNGLWTPMGTPATLTSTTAFATTADGLALGVNTFEWKVTFGTCITTDNVTITNSSITTANAGIDKSVCSGTTVLSANLPNFASGESGLWSNPFAIPGVIFATPSSWSSSVTGLPQGNSTLRWTISNGSCSSSNDVSINVNAYVADAGNNQNICTNTTTLIGSDPAPGTGTWTLVSGSGVPTTPTSSTTVVTGVNSAINTFRWTVTQGSCPYSDDVTVFMNSGSVANAGPDQIVCTNIAILDADIPAIGTGQWTTGTVGVTFTNTANAKSPVANLPAGGTTFRWTVTNGACSTWDDVLISNNDFSIASLTPVAPICTDTYTLDGINPGSGTGIWTLELGGGTFVNPTYYKSQVINIARGDNTYRWTVTNGFCSDFADIIIKNYSVTANAGLDAYTCTGNYLLDGNNPAAQSIAIPNIPATGVWTKTGLGTIVSPSLFNSNATGLPKNLNKFTWTISNGFCSASDEVSISNDTPTLPNAGPDDTFCGIDFAPAPGYNSIYNKLSANAPDYTREGIGEVGVWTQTAGASTFLNSNTTTNLLVDNLSHYSTLSGPDFWNQFPTINTYAWTITYKLCSLTDLVSIINAAPYDADAGDDQKVCYSEANLDAQDLGSGAQTHIWTEISPGNSGAVIANPSQFNSNVTNLQNGPTTFRWTKQNIISLFNPNYTCTVYDDVVVDRVLNTGRPNAGPDRAVCGSITELVATSPEIGFTPLPLGATATGVWTTLRGTGSFANATSNSTFVSSIVPGLPTNVYRWTITYTDGAISCISTDDVEILNANPSDAVAGADQITCLPQAQLSATRPQIGSGIWSVTGGGGTITNATCQAAACNSNVINMAPGQNTIKWTMTKLNVEHADGLTKQCDLEDELEIWNWQVFPNAGSDQTICIDQANLEANIPDAGSTGLWTTTGGGGILINANSNITTVTNLSSSGAGVNTLRWTLSNLHCNDYDELTIINNNPTNPSAGADQNICITTANLTANPPSNGTGVWSVLGGGGAFTNSLNPTTSVTGIPVGANTYTWTISKAGCSEFDEVIINNNAVVASAGVPIPLVCGTELGGFSTPLLAVQPSLIKGWTGVWSVAVGQGNFSDATAFNSTVSYPGGINLTGLKRYRWTVSGPNGPNPVCTATSTVDVNVYVPETAVVNPTSFSTCASSSTIVPLSATVVSNPLYGSGSWSQLTGETIGSISNFTLNNATVTNLGYNISIFRWTVVNNTCPSTADLTITNNYVTANAGPDESICTDTYLLSGSDPTVNDKPTSVQAHGLWQLSTGATGVFDDATLFNTTISGLNTTNPNTLRWTVTKGACVAWDEVVIRNNQFTVTANVDQTVCNDWAILNGQQPGAGASGVWTNTGGNGIFVKNTLYNTRVDALSVNPNKFLWTITNANCSAFDEVIVYNNQVTSIAGSLQRICATTATLGGNLPPTGGSGNWTGGGVGSTIVTPSAFDTQVINLASGQNTFTWTVSKTLNSVLCSNSTSVDIWNDLPTPALVEVDNSVCTNSTQISVLTIPSIGTGVWSADKAVTYLNATSSYNVDVTNLVLGQTKFTWTVTNLACTSTDDVIITNNSVVANANIDASTNCLSTYTLQGIAPAQGTGAWTLFSGGSALITNSLLRNSDVSNLPAGSSTFRWTVTLGACSDFDDVIITNNSVVAEAGIDISTCSDTYPNLNGSITSGSGTGIWSSDGNTANVTTPTLFNTGVTGLDPGSNTFTWTVTSNTEGCISTDQLKITNNKITSNAGLDQETCNTTVNLAASGVGTWTQPAGNVSAITNSTSAVSSVTGLTTGNYTYRWTVINGSCTATDDVVVTNSSTQTAIASTGAAEVCDGNGTLITNPLLFGESGLWTPFTASGTIANNTLTSTAVTGLGLGNNTFRWTITRGTNVTCTSFADVLIANNQVTASAGADQDICSSTATLVGNNPLQGTGTWTKFGFNPAIIADATLYGTTVSNLSDNTSHGFTWTVTKGICGKSDDVFIRNNRIVALAGADLPTCTNTITLAGNDVGPVGATGVWTKLPSSTAIIVALSLYNTAVNQLEPGPNQFTWTVTTAGGCPNSDDVIVTYNQVTANAGIDQETCNTTVNLAASGLGTWTQPAGNASVITNSTSASSSVTGLTTGSYTYRWTVVGSGCTATDDVVVTNSSTQTAIANTGAAEVCDGNGTLITNPLIFGETGLWTPFTASGTIANNTLTSTAVTGLGLGNNTFRWTITRGTNLICTSFANVLIANNQVTANAGADQDICTSTATLVGNNPLQGTGTWTTFGFNPAIIADATLYGTTVSNLSDNTSHGFTWTVTKGICGKSDDVYIRNNRIVAVAGLPISTCFSSFNLDGNDPGTGTGTWSVPVGSLTTFSNATLYNTTVNMLVKANPYSEVFTWTITNNGLCPSASTVTVNNNAFIVFANADSYTCDGTFSLLGRDPLSVSPTATGVWTIPSGSGIFTNSLTYNATVSGLDPGNNSLTWTISDKGCTAFDDVLITNDQVTATATGFMTCDNNTAITAVVNPITQGASGVWTVDNQTTQVVALPSAYITTVSGLVPNSINRLRWTVTRGACSVNDTMNIEYFVPNANITIPDIVHACSDTIQLIADSNIGTGTGAWSFGSTQVTIDDNTATTTIARKLEISNNVFRWTVSNRGCVKYDEVTINNSKPLNTAGSDQSACSNAFTMNAQTPTATGSGWWDLVSGTVTIADRSLATTTVTNVGTGTNILQWTITDKGCSSSKQFRITNNLTSPNAGVDVSVCENRVTLSGNSLKPGQTGLWSIDGGVVSEVFSSTSVNNPVVTNLRQGIITFAWTITNGTCTATDRVVVTNNTPTVDAGPDRIICDNFVTLAGNNPDPGNTGVWTIGNTNVVIANKTNYNTNITNLSQGSNLFTWTIDNGICTSSDNVLITSNSITVVAGIPYTEDCADTLYLEATVPPVGATGLWSAFGGGTVDNPTSYSTIARGLGADNTLRWTITAGTCSFYNEIKFVSLLPTKAATAIDKPVCTTSAQITANPASGVGESGLWTKVVGSSTVSIVNPTSFQTLVNNLDPGINVFRWTISNSQCSTSDLITITNNEVFADAGVDHIICDSAYSISANVTTGSGVWISTTPGVVIANSTSANTSVSKLRFGNNNFQWIVSYNGCTDVDEVIIKSDLPRNVSAGSDTSICSGTANLSGTNPGTGNSGLWQVTGGAGTFANSTTNQTIVTGLSTGGNIFKWTVTVGSCSASDQVSINNNSLYVTAGTNQAICNVNSLQLSGTIPGVGIIGTWSVNGGTGTFVNNSIFNTIVSNITKGTNTYRWTLTDGTCTNFADVEVVNNTPDPASVGPDTLICIDNHPLNAVIVANGTGSWSVTSGSATIANITSRNTSASGINKGLNTFTWTVNKNGCKLSDDINVTNNSVNVFANADFVTCTSAHDATIIGNVPVTGETGAWTKISAGPGVITTSANNVTTVTGLGNGGTIFRWTIANATCSLSDDVTITDNYYTTTAIANGYDNCVSFSQIQGGVVPSGASGIWSSTAADVTFDNNTSVLTWVRNLPGGTTSITWTITKDGCSSPASFSLLNNAIYTSAGADQIVCQTSTTLNAQALLGSETGKWVVVPNTVVITNTANPASAVSNLGPGNNTFTWTLSGNGCSVFDNVIISNNSFTVTAGSDQISCGSSYPLVASDPLGGTGLWTIGSGTGSFAAATNFATTVSNMNNGSNTFLWTAKRNGCTASDDVIITNDLYTATAGADRAICSNQTTVTAQPLNATWGTNGKWTAQTGGGVFVSPSSASSLVTGLANGENKLVWTVSKGTCVSFDEMIITNNSITATAGTPETTCNNFATLSATPLSATGVGLWSGGGVTTSIVTPTSATTNVINLQQGTNTFAWTVTDKGCTGTSTVQVISNFFRAFAGNDQTRTVDNALLTAQLPNPAATGTWSIFSGNGSFANINSGSSAVTLLGYGINTFRWTVDWNSCTSTDDVNIIYNSIAAEAGTDQTICTGNTFLTATAPFPGTGKWTIVQGFGKFMFDTEPNTEVTGILPGSVNIFRWTVSIGGFSTSDEVNIINGEFTISAGVPNPKETCIPQATMTAQSAGTGLGTWTVITGNGSFANANLETTLITNLSEGPNIFQWQVTKLNGCKDSATIQVNYNMPPTAAFEMNNTQGCSPVNVIFTNTSTGSGLDPLTSYYWNFGDRDTVAFTPNSRNYIALYDDRDSTSNITLVATNASGCKDTVTHQVTAFRIPFVEFYPSPISQTWPRSQVNFENTSNQNYPKYSWDFGDGKTQLDFAFNSNFSHDYPTWGTYTITLSVSSANCDADTQQTITINPPLPKNIGGRNYPGCAPFPVKFTNGTEYCDEWFWDFGDGGSSDSITPDYTYDTPGMYIVNLYGWGPGSPNSGPGKFGDPGYNRGDSTFIRKDTVYVFATPVADFLIKPDTVMLPNSEVRCYNRSTNADIYSWNFGDNGNEVFTEENPTHFYSETGTYYIILRVATNTNPQCYDDTINTMPIIVLPAGVCKFPNAFSPNPSGPSNGSWNDNDVSNDIFHPKHRGVDLYKLEIFNRWGEKIFESNDPAFGWDGYRDGKLLPQDVYVWKVTGRYRNGVPFKNAGDVTLIR